MRKFKSLSLNLNPKEPEVPRLISPVKSTMTAITPYLSLGSENDAAGPLMGITHLLNVSISSPKPPTSEYLNYKKIPLKDMVSEEIENVLAEALSFIDDAKNTGGHVLVYCYAGISRSVTITLAYLMVHCEMRLDDAYKFVKQKKPDISPNIGFMGQLVKLEKSLVGQS